MRPKMTAEQAEQLELYSRSWSAHIERLSQQNPKLHFITLVAMASDLASADRATELVNAGTITVEKAMYLVGSFARLDWAMARLPRAVLFETLLDLWTGCDPDDSRPDYLQLWRDAYEANGCQVLLDNPSKPLPEGDWLAVYRGQKMDAPTGFAWSLSSEVAQRFARGAGVRAPLDNPVVYETYIPREAVLAYLTDREEEEIIVDLAIAWSERQPA